MTYMASPPTPIELMPPPPDRPLARSFRTHPSFENAEEHPDDIALTYHSTDNVMEMLSVAAQHCTGPKGVNFRRFNLDFTPHIKHYSKPMSQPLDGPDDEWEFVDFERVFSKAPALGGVLENCEIQFRSVPESPIQQLVEGTLNNVPRLNDHPFDFRSRDTSRHNTAPGTPLQEVLRVPSITPASLNNNNNNNNGHVNDTIAEDSLSHATLCRDGKRGSQLVETTVFSPNTAQLHLKRTGSGREMDIVHKPIPASRVRTTSTSSTLSDNGNDDDRKNAKLEKNRQSARDCRKRKKEYIGALEISIRELTSDNNRLLAELQEKDKIIGRLMMKYSQRAEVGVVGAAFEGQSVDALSTANPGKRKKKQLHAVTAGGVIKRARV